MSHFTLLVTGENVESQLIPFQENNMGDCPKEYLEFEVEYKKKDFKKEVERIFEEMQKSLKKEGIKSYIYKDFTEYAILKAKNKYEEFLIKYGGYIVHEGNLGCWHNPNAKWDWYQVGGRWAGSFLLKSGRVGGFGKKSFLDKDKDVYENGLRCDIALKKDIDFEKIETDVKSIKKLKEQWDKIIKGEGFYKPEYFLKKYGTKENYVKREMQFYTHAALIEGKWIESGAMGWFGCSSESTEESTKWSNGYLEKVLKPLKADTKLTLVDCHI